MKHFRVSFLVTFICLGISAWWGYTHGGVQTMLAALGIAVILGVMEVSLSFDNAVVNASVLKTGTSSGRVWSLAWASSLPSSACGWCFRWSSWRKRRTWD